MARLLRVAAAADVPTGSGKAIEVEGRLLAIFNAGGGRYYASSPLCPHEDGPLADGVVDGPADRPSIICPWHAFDFDLRTGACSFDPDLTIPVYPVRVEGADLLVELP
jgi:nitrite reductase (NADH) small subunit